MILVFLEILMFSPFSNFEKNLVKISGGGGTKAIHTMNIILENQKHVKKCWILMGKCRNLSEKCRNLWGKCRTLSKKVN